MINVGKFSITAFKSFRLTGISDVFQVGLPGLVIFAGFSAKKKPREPGAFCGFLFYLQEAGKLLYQYRTGLDAFTCGIAQFYTVDAPAVTAQVNIHPGVRF